MNVFRRFSPPFLAWVLTLGAWAEPVSLATLLARQTDLSRLPALEEGRTGLASSSDITNDNRDFVDLANEGRDGFVTLADLRGPGFVSRIWMKGWGDDARLLRVRIDDAPEALELSVADFFGGRAPFAGPWARRENGAAVSRLPLPYRKSLLIQIHAGKPEGAFQYHITHTRLPKEAEVVSFPVPPTAEDSAALAAAANWTLHPTAPAGPPAVEKRIQLGPGDQVDLPDLGARGTITEIRVRPEGESASLPARRPRLLRDVVVTALWDGHPDPSVECPLGDFFGQVWRATRYASLAFGADGGEWYNRFPMPFDTSARLRFTNEGDQPQAFTVRVWVSKRDRPMADASLGYFHAGFQRSEPDDLGPEHPVLRIQGDGAFVGGLLSVVSRQEIGWGLDGDDSVRVDEEQIPGWRGTGTDDAFDAGGPHPAVTAGLFSGLLVKVPHKTSHYRLHTLDAPRFHSSIDVQFERGGQNNSPLFMESTAFYYLRRPATADTLLYSADARQPPPGQWDMPTIMTDLGGLERLGDTAGAIARIEEYNAAAPRVEANPFLPLLELRRLALLGSLQGFDAVRAPIAEFQSRTTNTDARAYADHWLWLHENPTNALVAVYAHPAVEVFLDGRGLGRSGSRDVVRLLRAGLAPGTHTLALAAASAPGVKNPWLHALVLAGGKGVARSGVDGSVALDPSGSWTSPGAPSDGWRSLAERDLGSTGPVLPLFSLIPHPVPGFPSTTGNIAQPPPEGVKTLGYRLTFTVP
jgi:hypothetical protein